MTIGDFRVSPVLFFLLLVSVISAKAQQKYFQQKLSYSIDVRLDDENKVLHGYSTSFPLPLFLLLV
jgi:hypothetical protein